jgi:hypothetical protein
MTISQFREVRNLLKEGSAAETTIHDLNLD